MRYLFLCVLLIASACSKEQDNDLTFIGGRVVNPNLNYVTLEHNDKIIDTIPLDSKNNFGYRFHQDK